MRIAIVVAFYDPRLDYFETTAARALAVDHEVHVVTTVRRSQTLPDDGDGSLELFPPGTTTVEGVTLRRLVPWLSLGQRVVAAGVPTALSAIQPDVVIQVVPAQLFSIPASRFARSHGIPLVYISGENSQQGPQKGLGLLLKRLYLTTVWRFIARRTAGTAARVIVTTEETGRMLRAAGIQRASLMPLPYRSDKFFLSQALRDSTRRSLGIEARFVTIFVGRFVPDKRIELIVEEWERTAAEAPDAHLLLVGSTGDEYSQLVCAAVAASPNADRITVLPFADSSHINGYLNAADTGVWPTVSVGIQQAMATGLLVLIPAGSPGEFLIQGPAQALGGTYRDGASDNQEGALAGAITAARSASGEGPRKTRADLAATLYSDVTLGDRVLGGLS
jgi:glycosyltransferase involved in cell wall biosynthesis